MTSISMKKPEDAPEAFQSAWNAHDMSAFGALFHVDTLILAVLTRTKESWRIQALENVTLTDPRSGKVVLPRAQGSGRYLISIAGQQTISKPPSYGHSYNPALTRDRHKRRLCSCIIEGGVAISGTIGWETTAKLQR